MHRVLALSLLLSLLAVATSVGATPTRHEEGYALATLDAMLAAGDIDEGERGLYLLTMLHDPDALPPRLRRPIEPDLPCLTTHVIEAMRAVSRARPAIRDAARRLLDDPPTTVGYIDSERFPIRVLYQEEGDVDLAGTVLDAAETGWAAQVEGLGWTAPTGEEAGEPVARLDIYVVDTAGGYSGHCEPLADNGLTSWTDALVRCQVDRGNEPEYLPETVIHEMHHALQFSEDATEFLSAFEMFCVHTINQTVPDNWEWMYFLPHFQADPHYSIFLMSQSNQLFHYGTSLFAQYLDERFGDDDGALGPRLWQAARQDGVIEIDGYWVTSPAGNEPDLFDAMDAYLAEEHGSSLLEALVEFAEWRLVLGEDDDGEHFEEGSLWRGAEAAPDQQWMANELPVIDSAPIMPPMPTGTSYLRVDTGGLDGAEQIRAAVELTPRVRWAVQAIRLMGDGPAEVVRGEIVDDRVELLVTAAGAEAVVLAVTNLGEETLDPDDWPVLPSDFTFSLELLRQPAVTAITPGAITAGMSDVEVTVEAFPVDEEAVLDLGPGITVRVTEVSRDGLVALVDVAGDAEPGARDVSVTNPGSDPGVLAGGFEVLAAPAPVLSEVEPGQLEPGTEEVLVVHGAGLLSGATASLGPGITVESSDVTDGTRMILTVAIAADASAGPRVLRVENPGGASTNLPDAVEVLDLTGDAGGCQCRATGSSPAGAPLLITLTVLALALLRRR